MVMIESETRPSSGDGHKPGPRPSEEPIVATAPARPFDAGAGEASDLPPIVAPTTWPVSSIREALSRSEERKVETAE